MKDIIFNNEIPDYFVRENIIQNIISKYEYVKKFSLGKSLVGRDITALQIGNCQISVLLTAAYHGMEWLTSLILLKFTDEICNFISGYNHLVGNNVCKAINRRGITIVPCVNPDGVEISLKGSDAAGKYKELVGSIGKTEKWQANARGVDINHNFDAGWAPLRKREIEKGISGPARTRYGGEEPESEPETKAITKLCRDRNFEYAIAFHSQGEEIYWDYGDKVPMRTKELTEKFSELSGYLISKPEGLAVGGGFKDWFISELNKPAFTIEIGKGENPLPISDFDKVYSKLEKALYFIAGI